MSRSPLCSTFAVLITVSVLLVHAASGFAQQNYDMEGAADYPLLPRLSGYFIAVYETADVGRHEFPLGNDRSERVEGTLTRISYWLTEGARAHSALEIQRHHQTAFAAKGGRVMARLGNRTVLRLTTPLSDLWCELVVTGSGGIYDVVIVERTAVPRGLARTLPRGLIRG